MKWRFFKVFSLALLAVFVVLGATAGLNGGGGGGNQNIPLKATFSAGPFGPYGPYGYLEGKIRNDNEDTWYVHQGTKAGQTQILIYQPATQGRLYIVIYEAAHGVNLHFDSLLYPPLEISQLPADKDCVPPFFIYPDIISPIQAERIRMGTTFECQYVSHTDEKGPWAELIPMTRQYLNFTKMRIGETKYVCGMGNTIQFKTKESIELFSLFQEPQYFTVKAVDFNGDGVMDWILTPFAERYKAVDLNGNLVDYPYGGVPRRVTSSAYRSCDHGTFLMPFELKITRK